MSTAAMEDLAPERAPVFEHVPQPSTLPQHATRRRKLTFLSTLAAVPLAGGVAALLRGPRAGVIAGGVTALALGALRWQLSRWFTESPAYEVIGKAGELELRRYPFHLEARADLEVAQFENALDRGFGRLACYVFGANERKEDIAMTTPVLTEMRDGRYSMAFVMPPGRALASLPRPADPRVVLGEVPERKVAVLPFRGGFTRENVEAHERVLLKALLDAGIVARGSIAFAGYDSPATLPFLRRNELMIEIV